MEELTLSELPLCPMCARTMTLAGLHTYAGQFSERNTFECNDCSIVFTEVAAGGPSIPERASALHHEFYGAMQ